MLLQCVVQLQVSFKLNGLWRGNPDAMIAEREQFLEVFWC